MASESEELLTVQEGATYLGVSRFKLSRLIADGVVRSFITPLDRRRRLVRKADLDELRTRPMLIEVEPTRKDRAAAHKVAA